MRGLVVHTWAVTHSNVAELLPNGNLFTHNCGSWLEEKTPDNIDGISIAATLSSHRQARRPFLYREFSGYGGQQAVWMGKWKGIRQNMLRKNNADPLKIELYNLQADIGESKDVAAENLQVVARIRTLMNQQHTPSELFPIRPLDQ